MSPKTGDMEHPAGYLAVSRGGRDRATREERETWGSHGDRRRQMHLQKAGPRTIPADRRCCEIKVNGQQCRGITVPGEKWCHMHGKFHALHNGYSSINVPVL